MGVASGAVGGAGIVRRARWSLIGENPIGPKPLEALARSLDYLNFLAIATIEP